MAAAVVVQPEALGGWREWVLTLRKGSDAKITAGDAPELPASGGTIDIEGTAFLTLSGGKITEVRTVFDSLALAVQTGAAEAPVVAGAQLTLGR